MAKDNSSVLALEPGIVLHSLPDQNWYYAFSVVTGDQFHLNQTSFWVLENISNGIDLNKLRELFLNTYEVPLKQGEKDLEELVDELQAQKIIRSKGNEEDKI